jgi:hypothetical protein
MSIIDPTDLQPLAKIYLFASMPSYLYRNFRKQGALVELTKSKPIETLTAEYESRATQENRSVEDVAVAYAILIAITYLPYQEAIAIFDRLDLSLLDWGQEIRDIFVKMYEQISDQNFQSP